MMMPYILRLDQNRLEIMNSDIYFLSVENDPSAFAYVCFTVVDVKYVAVEYVLSFLKFFILECYVVDI